MKTNIMLIVFATLTIATANAQWQSASAFQIVNNTPVPIEIRTWPDGKYFTLNQGKSIPAPSLDDTSLDFGWGVDDTDHGTVVLNKLFDDQEQQGTMASSFAVVSGNINLGQAWFLDNLAYSDTLVLTGSPVGNTMQLTATRKRGVIIKRNYGGDVADVFCLDTGVEFGLNVQDIGRCPFGETRVVMGADANLQPNIYAFSPTLLIDNIHLICSYNEGYNEDCSQNANTSYINGEYEDGFASIPYTTSNSQITLLIW